MADRHPATTGLLRWFEYDHLPPHLQAVSKPIGDLAHDLVELLPDGPELSAGLRKLLEAKDCLVRAALDVPPERLASTRHRGPYGPCHMETFRTSTGLARRCVRPRGHEGEHEG